MMKKIEFHKKEKNVKKSTAEQPSIQQSNSKQLLKKSIRASFRGKMFKSGTYSISKIGIVIAAAVLINLVVNQIPSKFTAFDLSSSKLYTIGNETNIQLENLDQDITIYLVTESGQEDETITKLLEKYEEASSHITVKTIDPVIYPNFISKYTADTLDNNSVIVESAERSKVIANSDLYEYNYDSYTYAQTVTAFDGEGQITSGIAYVTSAELPIMYTLEGHSEIELSTELQTSIAKENIEIKSLNLLTAAGVPEDAAGIFILSPVQDLSTSETEMIIQYLDQGGKAFITSSYSTEALPNFDSILAHLGVERVEGIVVESDSNFYYPQYRQYLIPELLSDEITSSLISSNRLVMIPVAQGIKMLDSTDAGLKVTPLLQTSEASYSKINMQTTTLEKEDGDIDGPFYIGMAISRSIESTVDTETTETAETAETTGVAAPADAATTDATADTGKAMQAVYFSSESILDSSMDQAVSGSNSALVLSALSWICSNEVTISIASKSVEASPLTLTAGAAGMWSSLTIVFIPLAIVIIGGIVWFKRRRK